MKGKLALKDNLGVYTVSMVIEIKVLSDDFNYNFRCDWLIWTTSLNVIGLLKCLITTRQVNKWKTGVF